MPIFQFRCRARRLRDGADLEARAYARSSDPTLLDQLVAEEIARRGLQLIGCEDAVETTNTPVPLADTLPFLLMEFEITTEAPLLQVLRGPVATLEPDPDASFWDQPWCPAGLQPLVFDGQARTYALLDGARCNAMINGFDLDLIRGEQEVLCLYQGRVAAELGDAAPHLVDITLTGQTPTRFQRSLFSDYWGHRALLLIRTDADITKLRNHLRHFTEIRFAEDDPKARLFRFWDPLVAATYFNGVRHRADRVDRMFRMADGTALDMLVEDGPDAFVALMPVKRQVKPPRRPLVFDAVDQDLMQDIALAAFGAELGVWLQDVHADRFAHLPPARIKAITDHVLAEGARCHCVTKDDYVYLCHMMLSLGGWFHLDAVYPDLTEVLYQRAADKRAQLMAVFLPAYEASPLAVIEANRAEMQHFMAEIPQDDRLTPELFRNFLRRFLGGYADRAQQLLAPTKARMTALNLSEAQCGQLLLLTLVWGHRFHDDPFYPWFGMNLPDALDAAWAAALH